MRASPEPIPVGTVLVEDGGLPGLLSLGPFRGVAVVVLEIGLRGVDILANSG